MMIPNVWGQGQLFAFSALDGVSLSGDDFCGTLLGDAYGVRFRCGIDRSLFFTGLSGKNPHFDAVTGDYISLSFDDASADSMPLVMLYARAHLIIGTWTQNTVPKVTVDGAEFRYVRVGVEMHDTADGCYTGLGLGEGIFAFAYGHSEDEVLKLVGDGLEMDIAEEIEKKVSFYRDRTAGSALGSGGVSRCGAGSAAGVGFAFGAGSAAGVGFAFGAGSAAGTWSSVSEGHALLRAKCLSVMKTQLYSPEGEFDRIRSTPDRYPHHHMWLWDSVFHAVGFRHLDAKLAQDLILSVFVHQASDGFIPHMADLGESSSIIQPPVLAWGALKVYEKNKDTAFLQTVFDANRRFLEWCCINRRLSEYELYTWNTGSDVNCRCDESGMDNSPRFDGQGRLFAIDFSCFMASDVRAMGAIAKILGLTEEVRFYENWYAKLSHDINTYLWSEKDCFYLDRTVGSSALSPMHSADSCFSSVFSVASFLPLFAGVASPRQARILAEELHNPATFGTPLGVPSVSASDPTYGSDMWRGPVWINYNYMIAEGLASYGFDDDSASLICRTIAAMEDIYRRTGVIFEFYDSEDYLLPWDLNRKGTPVVPYNPSLRYQSIRDYGWSTTLLYDWLMREL